MSFSLNNLNINAPLRPGEKFTLSFSIQNIGARTEHNLQGRVLGSKYWNASAFDIGTLLKNKLINQRIEVQVRYSKYLTDLEESLSVQILSEAGAVLETFKVTLSVGHFIGYIRDMKPPPTRKTMNLLLFGETGSGKTTLIRTFFSLINQQIRRQTGGFGGSFGTHGTTTFNRLPLTSTISIYDAWGASRNGYKGAELELMLQGGLPPGWPMDKPVNLTDPTIVRALSAQPSEHKIDAVFFTITSQLVEDTGYMQRLRSWVLTVQRVRRELNPFLLLTKADEIDPGLRTTPNLQSELLNQKILQISAATGVDANCIFPTIAYILEYENTFVVDKFAYLALHQALQCAQEAFLTENISGFD